MQLQITIFLKTSSTYRRKERGFVEDWLCYCVAWCLGDRRVYDENQTAWYVQISFTCLYHGRWK